MLREHREHCGRYIKLPVVLHLGPLSGATLCSSREKNRPANTAIVREHAACDWTSYLREALQKL